jgi:O-antigen ligase
MLVEFFDSPDEYMEGVGRGSFGSRFDNYKYSLILFQDNLFFGVGFGGWQGDYMNMKYPHNILFELISETGIF